MTHLRRSSELAACITLNLSGEVHKPTHWISCIISTPDLTLKKRAKASGHRIDYAFTLNRYEPFMHHIFSLDAHDATDSSAGRSGQTQRLELDRMSMLTKANQRTSLRATLVSSSRGALLVFRQSMYSALDGPRAQWRDPSYQTGRHSMNAGCIRCQVC